MGRISRGGLFSISIAAALMLGACSGPLDPLKKELRDTYGINLLQPPRSDVGAGWAYTIEKPAEGNPVAMELCGNMFSIAPREGDAQLAKIKTVSKTDLKLALSLLERVVSNGPSLEAALGNVEEVEIDWGNPKIHTYSVEAAMTRDGAIRPIRDTCANVINARLEFDRRSAERIFVAQTSISVTGLKYTFRRKMNVGATATITPQVLGQIVSIRPGISHSFEGDATLVINTPMNIGIRPFSLSNWKIPGLHGSDLYTIYGRMLAPEEFDNLLER
jgi:hypothetical protein